MSVMDLVFLGTAGCHPSPVRGVSGTVLRNEGQSWLVDCGEGTQMQLMRSKLKLGKINKIFITHLHGDHLFGLPGLLCTLSQGFVEPRKETMEIYGPQGLRRYLRVNLELSRSFLTFSYSVHELRVPDSDWPDDWQEWQPSHAADGILHPNETEGRVIDMDEDGAYKLFEDAQYVVCAAPLSHRIPCFGYAFHEKPQPGRLDPNLLKARGIPPGPLYSQIKAGKAITAPDGTIIQPEDVVGPSRPGRKVVILGDTKDSSRMASLAMDADVLVHETSLADEHDELCRERGHSTPAMAGKFASQINCKHLIISHFSQRYYPISHEAQEGEQSVRTLLDQARAAFPEGVVTAAEDLIVIPVPAKR